MPRNIVGKNFKKTLKVFFTVVFKDEYLQQVPIEYLQNTYKHQQCGCLFCQRSTMASMGTVILKVGIHQNNSLRWQELNETPEWVSSIL